jgi:hypothetical protein
MNGVVLIVLLGAACTTAPAPAPAPPAAPGQQPLLPPDNAPDDEAPPLERAPDEPLPKAAPVAIDLVGIWTSEETTEYGTVYAETILERNNNYSHQVRWRDLMTYEVGVYQAGDNFIHFSVRDYQPKSYKGTELSRPLSWTVYYTVVDENTMIWEDRIMNTRWQVHRRGW